MLWNHIINEHGEMLYRAAYRILRDDGDAQDVVQDVLLEAFRKHDDNGTIPAGGLLRRMVTLRAIDRLRRRRPARRIDDLAVVSGGDAPDCAIQQTEQMDRLRQAIGRLPQREAECFLLRYAEGMSYGDIAEMLGTSPSAVSTATHKARTKLRKSMKCTSGRSSGNEPT
ncbi:MAG: RNA polymerase sigma factor [Pirellulaceae bacterium]